jgi:hypothetical protein
MQVFHAETVVAKDGQPKLGHPPFAEGEPVHVFISSAAHSKPQPLKGSVLRYEQPFESAAEADWYSSNKLI